MLSQIRLFFDWLCFSRSIFCLFLISFLIIGCGNNNDVEHEQKVLAGQFVDSPVEGLTYTTDTQSGVTDKNGTFYYLKGEEISFSVGSINFGQASAGEIITPVDLTPGAQDEKNPVVLNICRILMTLDSDGDPENGIAIEKKISDAIINISIDFNKSLDGNPAVEQLLDLLNKSGLYSEPVILTTEIKALHHLAITLCLLNGCPDTIWFMDSDGDGYGQPTEYQFSFSQPSGYVDNSSDCDDAVSSIYPGAPEICENTIDEDCNGEDAICPDTDGDGVKDPIDAFPSDPAASIDTDSDGYPDAWNDGYTKNDSTTGLFLDAFPDDPLEVADFDNDGIGDNSDETPVGNLAPPWTTYQGNRGHTGHVPVELDTTNFSVRWSTQIESTSLHPIVFDDGYLLATDSHILYVIDNTNGELMWTKDFSTSDSLNPPAYAEGIVYVQTGGHENSFLWAFDVDTSDLIFQSSYGNQWSTYYAPTIDEGVVYIAGGYYGGMYAFDSHNGEQIWFTELNQYDEFTPAVNDQYAVAYTGDYNPELTVVDKFTGSHIFSIPDPDFNWDGWSMNLSPVMGSQNNVIAIHDGRLISFDLETQTVGWQLSDAFMKQPAVANGVIYVLNGDSLEARSEGDGSLIWSWSAEELSTNEIIATDNLVFVTSTNGVHAINIETHKEAWRYPFSGKLCLSNGALYINSDSTITAINIEGDRDDDGLPDWWEKSYGRNMFPGNDDDLDGLTTLEEYNAELNPLNSDTDGDGLLDGEEVLTYGTDPKNKDTDKDDLTDYQELIEFKTNPNAYDSDADGIDDKREVENGLDPNDGSDAEADFDGDGYTNRHEVYSGSDINDSGSIPVIGDWGMVQGNASHNGFQPLLLDEANFSLRWTKSFEDQLNDVAVGDGKVFLNYTVYHDDETLVALDALDGSVTWSYGFGALASSSGPGYAKNLVYIHTGGHEDTAFWAFDPETGEQVFRGAHSSQWPRYSAPTILDGRAFMNGDYYGGMQAFDALTGDNLWSSTAADWADYWEPAANADHVFLIYEGDLRAVDPLTGSEQFTIDADLGTTTPVIGQRNNVLVAGATLVSFDIEAKSIAWQYKFAGGSFGMPAVGNGSVYCVRDGALKVINEINGEDQWSWRPASDTLTSNIVLTASHVFVASDTTTYAVKLSTHEVVWRYDQGGRLALGNDGAIYINSGYEIVAVGIE